MPLLKTSVHIRQVLHHFMAHQGIGEATVRKLVGVGCRVVIADVAVEKGEALAADLISGAAFCKCDVT